MADVIISGFCDHCGYRGSGRAAIPTAAQHVVVVTNGLRLIAQRLTHGCRTVGIGNLLILGAGLLQLFLIFLGASDGSEQHHSQCLAGNKGFL